MSSIAYVADNKILEFHRINGNSSINFWRYSTKGFTDFKQGDLLFFLTRGRSKQKEKAIVGYGRCKEINKLPVKQVWQRYEKKNGFSNYEEFNEYVIKNSEGKIKHLSNIYLEEVVFFQNEILLSDFNFELSNHLVSYTYLDKNQDITSKILENGIIDIWSIAANKTEEDIIENSKIIHELNLIVDKFNTLKKVNIKKAHSLLSRLENFSLLKENRIEYYNIKDKVLTIALPFICNSKNYDEKFKMLIGHIIILKYYLNLSNIVVKFKIVSDIDIKFESEKILREINDDKL